MVNEKWISCFLYKKDKTRCGNGIFKFNELNSDVTEKIKIKLPKEIIFNEKELIKARLPNLNISEEHKTCGNHRQVL